MGAPKGNKYALGNRGGGRPAEYQEEFCEVAYKLCLLGATDEQIADIIGCTEQTINNWKQEHEEFFLALSAGKEISDMEVAYSLYQGTQDREVIEEQAIKVKIGQFEEEVQIVEVKKIIPGDFRNQQFWLKNRKSKIWRDKQELDVQGGFALIINEKDAKADD